jgi:hypothetical protein
MWLTFFLGLWALILLGVAVFIVVDACNAFDENDATPTFSGYIKAWKCRRPYRTPLLGAICASLVLVPVYLFLHLVLELI